MKQILSYAVAAMILSVSSIALVGALMAQDVFMRQTQRTALVFVLLSILYFVLLVLLDRLQTAGVSAQTPPRHGAELLRPHHEKKGKRLTVKGRKITI